MILFPAIDLIGGKVVRLKQGKRSAMDIYGDDPLAQAQAFAQAGAAWVHVVDLSRAFGEDEESLAANQAAITAICQSGLLHMDAGGGVRTMADVQRLAEAGVSRIALGTPLVKDPAFAKAAAREFGDLLVADVAAKDGQVHVNGWREDVELSLNQLVDELCSWGYKHLVYTDIARDGCSCGIDARAYEMLASRCGFPVVASGGIASLEDIRALCAMGDEVIEGIIVGRALYEGQVDLKEALELVQPATQTLEAGC